MTHTPQSLIRFQKRVTELVKTAKSVEDLFGGLRARATLDSPHAVQLNAEAYLGEARGNGVKAARIAGYKGNDATLRKIASVSLTKGNIASLARSSGFGTFDTFGRRYKKGGVTKLRHLKKEHSSPAPPGCSPSPQNACRVGA